MNKSLQRWMDKPGWQLCLWQWGFLSMFGIIAYAGLLRPIWQQRAVTKNEIVLRQQQVEKQTLTLALLPSPALIQQQINVLLSEKTAWQRSEISLAHQVGEAIMPFGGQVIRWQRRSEPEVENSVAYQQWETTLRINFYGLCHLLHLLSEIRSPILVKFIALTHEGQVLIVKLTLTEYLLGDMNGLEDNRE